MLALSSVLALTATLSSVSAHLVLTYPGSRGNNLHTNGTDKGNIIPGSLGTNWNESAQAYEFPYGMQWQYPCGGIPTDHFHNRTKWPVNGGAVAFQPGWFNGHLTAFIYVNLGIGNEPLNYSHPMIPVFQLTGPTNFNYSGSFCLPQLSIPALPDGYKPKVGDNATIQVIETAVHGAALYSCVDITFADDDDVELVTPQNCFNGTDPDHLGTLGSNLVFTTKSLTNAASSLLRPQTLNTVAMTVGAALLAAWLL